MIEFFRYPDFLQVFREHPQGRLFDFLNEWKDNPKREFIDERLEERRKALFEAGEKLGRILGALTSPVMSMRSGGAFYSIWDKESGPIPEWVHRNANTLNETAESFVAEYDRFLRETRLIVAE